MHKMNGQSFTTQKVELKCSEGSETLFCTVVKHLLGQGIGRGRMGLAHSQIVLDDGDGGESGACTSGEQGLSYKDPFLRLCHSSAVISQISEGKQPET